ncbi:MAG TPA: DUF333 domain-containing protein [bacterium]|nr:DUF333 domain-containing protein [bacterium]
MTKTFKIILVLVALALLIGGAAAFYYLNFRGDKNIVTDNSGTTDLPDNKMLIVKDQKIEEKEGDWDIEITYPTFDGKDNLNSLIENFVTDYVANFKESANSYESAMDDLAEDGEVFPITYYLHARYDKGRFDENYVSFVLAFEYYSGGAHGGREYYGFAYDLQNDKEMKLSDLFVDRPNYLNDISQFCFDDLRKQIQEKTGDDYMDEEWLKDGVSPEAENFQAFIFDEDSITFYFPPYQVAAYALGDFTVEFPWINNLGGQGEWTGLANPASLNCQDKGGQIMMKENALGQYGVCLFEDNRQCEEWSLFYGYCPEGGVKVTGFDYESEIYCAILGGQTTAGGSVCTFANGKTCLLDDLYQGRCDRNLLSADDELNLYTFVENNLAQLSPEPAVLGGKFYITKLDVLSLNYGEVEYEDGHIALKAGFNFTVNSDGVKISDFHIIK